MNDDTVLFGLPTDPDTGYFAELSASVWERRWYSNFGSLHDMLQRDLSRELRVPHGLLTSSGTSALQVALTGLPPGGEVITTPATFAATSGAIISSGLQPVFVDIDPETWNLDPRLVAEAITPRTVAIVPVHLFGVPCDVDSLAELAASHALRLVYDAAHAFGGQLSGRGLGSFGDASAFSLHATKLMHTGEGGILTTTPELVDVFARVRNFGLRSGVPVSPGINAKMPELSAALGLAVLRRLPQEREARIRLRKQYDAALDGVGGLSAQSRPPDSTPSELFYSVQVHGGQRDALVAALSEVGITTRTFPLVCGPGTSLPQVRIRSHAAKPIAVSMAENVLCLPFHSGVSEAHVERVSTIVRRILTLP